MNYQCSFIHTYLVLIDKGGLSSDYFLPARYQAMRYNAGNPKNWLSQC